MLKLFSRRITRELYKGIFNREPDAEGLRYWSRAIRSGLPLHDAIAGMLASDEFRIAGGGGARAIRQSELPDIRESMGENYSAVRGLDSLMHNVFTAVDDSSFDRFERLIGEHRFYDSFGGWGYSIDLDKRVTAAIVRGLGAKSCLDIGCSTGPVLSLLAGDGLDVTGIDASHLAFALAYPAIRGRMLYGDLLSVDIDRRFDAILAMDIFEHLNPFKLDATIARAASLLDRDGFLYVNSPIFGSDDVFGTPFPLHLPQWKTESQTDFWRHIPSDAKGWPWDGHLIWASVAFWERSFSANGLVRDRTIETALQESLAGFFATHAPARKAVFVLKGSDNRRDSSDVARNVQSALRDVEGLPKATTRPLRS